MEKVTIKDVAKESEVSIATVSRVLNEVGYVNEQIKVRVLQAVEKLNYQPNAVARSLKRDQTNTIGVILPDISNPYFMTMSKAIEDCLYDHNYNLIFCSGDEKPEKEKKLLQLLLEKRVDAIVLSTSSGNDAFIKRIHLSGTPVILMDRRVDYTDLKLDLVEEDNVKGAYELTKYLIQLGHTKVGVLNGLLDVSTGADRLLGFRQAIRDFGIRQEEAWIYNGGFTQEGGGRRLTTF
ncbi:LacI family DNA-binding transcriptional regulator [Shouchella shacheensis]|uniref:LacI family DNA-binding transcriptional regulator n=1 Tax=Shouchella shacheensis TaxID=1649580 RepID=UPI000B0D6BBF|nr:LacI family DNA-binding transcriptional regulator [Shouchella shacheensis]